MVDVSQSEASVLHAGCWVANGVASVGALECMCMHVGISGREDSEGREIRDVPSVQAQQSKYVQYIHSKTRAIN